MPPAGVGAVSAVGAGLDGGADVLATDVLAADGPADVRLAVGFPLAGGLIVGETDGEASAASLARALFTAS